MREIKFRAWDAVNKTMEYRVNVSDGHAVKYGYQSFSPDNTVFNSPIMQFTGLHDKNFQEIYEGDIIQRVLNPIEIPHPIIIRDFVEYRGGCFILSNRTTLLRTSMPNIEVIGNVYENPDLLKGE